MEMRSLARCLRTRPTCLLSTTQPSSILCGQFLTGQISLRFSSTDNNSPSKPPRRTKFPPRGTAASVASPQQHVSQTSGSSDFDQILDKLNINNSSGGSSNQDSSTPKQQQSGPVPDSLSLSRAVGMSAETDSYRLTLSRPELKLGPTLGRQVLVEPEKGIDLASSLRILNSTCSTNRVKQQSIQQKFHVRRGQVRKNLRMQRWRKLFKYSFKQTVSRIQRMRAQGW
ncbi:hypothetical protein EYZ11_003280 [Aspergillus tanneri]|uniref:Ribosomal protein S21 n=1 Tax=Aspergillus tanneri TaxID=1220188 RepID=A0A4S3JQT0_9EURO|nr:uncharacterized protein ATNIH1004_003188 [Aspergillus tanneri]KAA8650501.1 hypothetical protein ATNIH1004_003188 [Aspergillus tanneri]THC97227.1 hypothetical protein EYZ11_003280 [Aspergillus tanneri]